MRSGFRSQEIPIAIQVFTYVGDGTRERKFQHFNYTPKWLKIFQRPVSPNACYQVEVLAHWGDVAFWHSYGAVSHTHLGYAGSVKIIDNGFEVDDLGIGSHPNVPGVTYDVMVIG